jgi:hypothetical protein
VSERAVPFHCPYCGEENLWPFEARKLAPQEPPFEARKLAPQEPPVEAEGHRAAWECRSCLRAFTVSMIGQLSRPSGTGGRP